MVVAGLALALLLSAEIPALTGRVVDTAGLLSPDERQRLEERLARDEEETSVQIVIAIIPTLEDEPLEDFSIRLAEAWRIGQKGLDNGAIILVVRDDQRVRIEVGYGLEPVIPDGMAGRIIRERIAPQFREGHYFSGLSGAIDGLLLAARKEYPPGQTLVTQESQSKAPGFFGGLFFSGIGWLILLGILRGLKLRPWLASGLAGLIAFPIFAYMAGWLVAWTSPIFAGLGFALGALVGRFVRISTPSKTTPSPPHKESKSPQTRSSQPSAPEVEPESEESFRGGGGKFGGGGASGSW